MYMPNIVHNKLYKSLILLVFAGLSEVSFALDSDIKQPVKIDAGSVTFNKAKGYAVYSGNVSIQQGTLKISAGKIEIFAPENVISRIEASGSPVSFEQKMEGGKLAKGTANIVRYLVKEKQLILSGNAQLSQGKDTFTSPYIQYAVNTGELKAGSNADTAKQNPDSSGRVKAIFYPSN